MIIQLGNRFILTDTYVVFSEYYNEYVNDKLAYCQRNRNEVSECDGLSSTNGVLYGVNLFFSDVFVEETPNEYIYSDSDNGFVKREPRIEFNIVQCEEGTLVNVDWSDKSDLYVSEFNCLDELISQNDKRVAMLDYEDPEEVYYSSVLSGFTGFTQGNVNRYLNGTVKDAKWKKNIGNNYITWAIKAAGVLNDANAAYEEQIQINECVMDIVETENEKLIYSNASGFDTPCNGTVLAYDTAHYTMNYQIDEEQLMNDIAIYNADDSIEDKITVQEFLDVVYNPTASGYERIEGFLMY